MKAVVGLGNIGEDYTNTRHNVGFIILQQYINSSFKFNKKLHSLIYKDDSNIYFMPTSFVNKSGEAIKLVLNYYNIKEADMLVISDDIDQQIGSFKITTGGGDGGHNGIKSINSIFTNTYTRLKVGVAPKTYDPTKHKAVNFVLKKFSKDEILTIQKLFNDSIKLRIDEFLNK